MERSPGNKCDERALSVDSRLIIIPEICVLVFCCFAVHKNGEEDTFTRDYLRGATTHPEKSSTAAVACEEILVL